MSHSKHCRREAIAQKYLISEMNVTLRTKMIFFSFQAVTKHAAFTYHFRKMLKRDQDKIKHVFAEIMKLPAFTRLRKNNNKAHLILL